MLKALQTAAESYLGHNISSALAAIPNLVALYQDVDDPFEYIGLKSLDDPNPIFRLLHESPAAAASYGMRLCRDYTDPNTGDEERRNMPPQALFTVLCTMNSPCIKLTVMNSAYSIWPYPSTPPSMDFTLGSDKIHDNPNDEYYWEAVRDTIMRGMLVGLELNANPRLSWSLVTMPGVPSSRVSWEKF